MSDQLLVQSGAARRDFFTREHMLLGKLAAEGQQPKALFVTCSDSRITPETLFALRPGDFFIMRNVANVVPPYYHSDVGSVAPLEFAVRALHVPHIVVCGHTDCGGIRALDQSLSVAEWPSLSSWLEVARPAQRDVDYSREELEDEERHQAIVERNVLRQLENLRTYPFVREAEEAGRLQLHAWVYYLSEPAVRAYDPEQNAFVA